MSFWPEGFNSAATITVNFDAESFEQPELPGEPLWGRYAFGRYGAQQGIYRILDLFERYGVTATFFVPAWDVERYPDVMEAIAKAGHDFGGRGYANENFAMLPVDEQTAVLEKSEAIFKSKLGAAPKGWRGPSGGTNSGETRPGLAIPGSLMSEETRGLLLQRGYIYDSGYCDDDIPYIVEGDGGKKLVEIPHFSTQSDRPYYQVHRLPRVVASAWKEELSSMNEVGGLFNLAISPRGDWGSGRGVRIRAVEAVLQELYETPRVWNATCNEIAEWTLKTDASTTTTVKV